MNKKLIASLLALGLVFSPMTGAINETYATEAPADQELKDETQKNEVSKKIEEIKGFSEKYKNIKNNPDYRLADNSTRDAFEKAMQEAASYAENNEASVEELKKHISAVKSAKANLFTNAKENLDSLKNSLIKADKIIANNAESSEKEDYKNLDEKIKEANDTLKNTDKAEVDGAILVKLRKELDELSKKAIEEFNDTNEYKEPTAEERENLGKEPTGEQASPEEKNIDILAEDIKVLTDSHQEFITNGKYALATDSEKKAYDDATDEYNNISTKGLSADNYDQIYAIVTKLAQAKHNIDGEKPSYKVIRIETKNPNEENNIIEVLKKLREYINTKDEVVKDLKNEELKKKYLDNVELAQDYSNFYALGNKKSLDTYKELEAYLAKLKADIEKEKTQTPGPIKAEETTEKKFENKDAAKKGLEDIINRTKGIAIDDFYGADEKDAKDSYVKNREEAKKAYENKDASLDDLNKAYDNFNKSIGELNKYLRAKLQKFLDDDKNFRESENYKKADANLVKSYEELIKQASEDVKKPSVDANELNLLYKKLLNTTKEIKGEISSIDRKLRDAISEGKLFMKSEAYLKATVSSNEWRKKAAENYNKLIERAEKLYEEGKIDDKLAEEILGAIAKSKDFIEGKIDETKFKNSYYYYLLKAVSEREEFKSVNQESRVRLLDALKMYAEDTEDDAKILSALETAINDSEIQKIIKKMEEEANPSSTRDKLLTDLTELINGDKKLKEGGFKYQKAQKALRDAYDLALKEAKELIADKKNPSEEEVRNAYKKLLNAKNSLDGDKFDELKNSLAARFKQDQLKIANPQDRKAIADKINALANPEATMDDALKVEKEFEALINQKKTVTTTTVAPQTSTSGGQVPTTSRPVSTVTNPGSIVRTGINGIAKVAAVLAVAAIILKLTSKKGEKNENN